MKKFLKAAALALCAALAFAVLIGCGSKTEGRVVEKGIPESFEGMVTVAIDDPSTEELEYYVQMDYADLPAETTALELIETLSDEGKVCFEISNGMVTKIGKPENGENDYILEQDTNSGIYLYLYTNVEKDMQGSDGVYLGKEKVEPAMVGISSMGLKNGAIIYISTIVFAA